MQPPTTPNTPAYSRLDPEKSGKFKRAGVATPTRSHRAVELALFAAFALLVIIGVVALYTVYSSDYRHVPNRVENGMKDDRINVLVIGIGGDKHPGGGKDLADAILLASFKPSTHQVALISVPRDLYLRIGRYGTHRINTAHAIGSNSGYPGGGPGLTSDVVSEVFQQPIHAYVRIDFDAFEKIIDDLGGVDINVQRGFYDFLFRDRFEPGLQHMDGKRALRYARYRYIVGPEGDNFARELRQQQVVDAIAAKLRGRGAEDVLKLASAARTLSAHTDTNLTTAQMLWFYRNFRDVNGDQIRHVSLKPFMRKIDVQTITDAGEAVAPASGSFAPIQKLSRDIFSDMRQVGTRDDIRLASTPPIAQESALVAAPAGL